MSNEDKAIRLAEQLMTVLDDGQFVSTYKFAVLLALFDLCREKAAAPSVTTRELALKVTELYWRQTEEFVAMPASGPKNGFLRQNTGKADAKIISLIREYRERHDWVGFNKAQDAGNFERLVDQIECKLIEMPLARLQRVGESRLQILYTIGWDETEDVNRLLRRVRAYQAGDELAFDNDLPLLVGVAENLNRIHDLMRPIIYRKWAMMISSINKTGEADLEWFLFGFDRTALKAIRKPLWELHQGRCFYCKRPIKTEYDIDHFLPWSRHHNDAIENLVLADKTCNGQKSDHYASTAHLERWLQRNTERRVDLAQIAADKAWLSKAPETFNSAAKAYRRFTPEYMLWNVDVFVPADVTLLRTLFDRTHVTT